LTPGLHARALISHRSRVFARRPRAQAQQHAHVAAAHAFAPPAAGPPPAPYPDARALSGALSGALSALALGEDVPFALAPLMGGGGGGGASLLLPRRAAPPPLLKGPSGPRRAGEGVEEEEQAVVSVEKLANGGLQARARPLCAPLPCARARATSAHNHRKP
jgi:hypothetical protein